MAIYLGVVGALELQDLINDLPAATRAELSATVIMLRLPQDVPDDSFGLQDEPRQPSASSGVIKGLTVEPHVSGDPCPICMEDCTENDKCSRLPCGHSFHRHCIAKWLKMNHICPLCRYELPCGPKPSRCIAMRAAQLQSHVDSLQEYIHLRNIYGYTPQDMLYNPDNQFANDEGDPTFGVDSLSEEELIQRAITMSLE